MALGEPLAEFRTYAPHLEIASCMIVNFVPIRFQAFCKFVIIDILHELLGAEHFKVVHRLPSFLRIVIRGIKQDAMRMDMRVKGAGGIMTKCPRDYVAGQPVADLSGGMYA